jgi:pimeloyl-ACP methyl ester carboxylesterase
MKIFLLGFFLLIASAGLGFADLQLESFAYPFPVEHFRFKSQQKDLDMAFMDLLPARTNGETVVLLHGKNFSGAYWEQTAIALSDFGYRVVIPDQIGFGKSTKPAHYQFTFQQLAENTRLLLASRGVTNAHVLGHSMGGMLSIRYALMFPNQTKSLLLVDPLGLEDWRANGVPYLSIDKSYEKELKQSREKLREYESENYYRGQWKPEYDRWVDMLDEFIKSPDYATMAWNQALTFDMIMTQPVCYECPLLKMPVLLIVGEMDRTAPGKELVAAELRNTLGNYPELGKSTVSQIANAKLIELKGVGHLPHVENFPQFIEPLKDFLKGIDYDGRN